MRTRSSRSYAVGPRDIYEEASGLLDTIEESFYLEDEDEETYAGKEEVRAGEHNAIPGREGETIAVQHAKRLIVKLRIPSKNATPTFSLRPVGDDSSSDRRTANSRNESALKVERRSLVVVLRMPRPACQVWDEDVVTGPDQQQVPKAAAEAILEAAAGEIQEELVGERLEEQLDLSATIVDTEVQDHIALQDEMLFDKVIGVQIEDAALEQKQDSELEKPLETMLGLDLGMAMENEEQTAPPVTSENEFAQKIDENVRLEEQQHSEAQDDTGSSIALNIEGHIPTPSGLVAEEEIEAHVEDDHIEENMGNEIAIEEDCNEERHTLDASSGKQQEAAELIRTAETEEHMEVHEKLCNGTKVQGQIGKQLEEQPENQPEEDSLGSSLGNGSYGSQTDNEAWHVTEMVEEFDASLLPTPLTMPSPELPAFQTSTPPPEPCRPPHSSKRSLLNEDTPPLSPPPVSMHSVTMKVAPAQSMKRSLLAGEEEDESLPAPKRDSPLADTQAQSQKFKKSKKRSLQSGGDEQRRSKKRRLPRDDTAPRLKKRSLPFDEDPALHSKKDSLSSGEGAPLYSEEGNFPLQVNEPSRSKKHSFAFGDAHSQSNKRRLPLDDTPETETRAQKRQRRKEKARETNVIMQDLEDATLGTGVVEAGRAAQQRRGVLPNTDRVASGHVQKIQQQQKPVQKYQQLPPKRPEKEPPSISGRTELMEQRVLYLAQPSKIRNIGRRRNG